MEKTCEEKYRHKSFFKTKIVFDEMHIQLKHFINVVKTSYYFNYMEIATD